MEQQSAYLEDDIQRWQYEMLGAQAQLLKLQAENASGLIRELLLAKSNLASLRQREIAASSR
jgi:hypothetical protein